MDNRAFKVSLAFLNIAQTPPVVEETKGELLSEDEIKKLTQNALKTYYPTFIQSYIRNLDVNTLLTLMYFLVKQFNSSTIPQENLAKLITPLKMKILSYIAETAMLDKGSLLETVTTYFKENPTALEEDVEKYVQQLLTSIKINTKRALPKVNRLYTQI